MSKEKVKKLFGTDGIRGKAYEYPLDAATVEKIGYSLAETLTKTLGYAPQFLVGRDTRESGEAIQSALTTGAEAAGARIQSAGVITTPGVAFLTRRVAFDAGVVISASHNPYYDNGIKIFSPSGKKLADEMERQIEEDLSQQDDKTSNRPSVGQQNNVLSSTNEADYAAQYSHYLAEEVAGDLRIEGIRLLIDCANGAASNFAPELFSRLGATVEAISAAPDGKNINQNCGALHVDSLKSMVQESEYDLGIAFDGDADRALFVDHTGKLIDGDYILFLLAESMRSQGRLTKDLVVATVMSNIGLEIALRNRGIDLVRAPVGDRFVLEEMLTRKASLGGEQSGHIIIQDISLAGDGMITAIEVLRAMRTTNQSLAELASPMKTFPQVLVNVEVKRKPALESVPEVNQAITKLENELQGRGRLLVRYSGTENLLRVMIEGETQSVIEDQAHQLANVIQKVLN